DHELLEGVEHAQRQAGAAIEKASSHQVHVDEQGQWFGGHARPYPLPQEALALDRRGEQTQRQSRSIGRVAFGLEACRRFQRRISVVTSHKRLETSSIQMQEVIAQVSG